MKAWATLFTVLVAASGAAVSACYVEAEAPVAVEGYVPQYYDGYVVYYDDVGRPFYYVNGAAVWVPVNSPFYAGLHAHWVTYRGGYVGWNAHYGGRFRAYRRR